MTTKIGWVVAGVAMVLSASAYAVSVESAETEAIRETLQYYLDGHATGEADIMAQAFHPSARLQWISDGEVSIRSLESYLSRMSGGPADDESQRERRISMVEYEGTAAVARIELDYPGALFIDYMQLLKVDGRWLIVNKIFHVERR